MYCNQCHYQNDDHARFCNNCGAELTPPENNAPPYQNNNGYQANGAGNRNGQPGFNYGMPYNTPYDMPPGFSPVREYTNVIPVISIIMGIVSMSPLAIIFAVISLIKFNEYDRSRFGYSGLIADSAGRMSKGLGITAIVIACLSIIKNVLILFAWILGAGFMWTEFMNEAAPYYYYEEESLLSLFIGII